MKAKIISFLFLLVNGLSAFLWIAEAPSAYEVGGYMYVFGAVQAFLSLLLLISMFTKAHKCVPCVILVIMQIFPIACYTIFQGADGGWISIFSVISLILGIYILCTRGTEE